MKPGTVIVIGIFIALAILVVLRETDDTCHLEDVSDDEIMAEAKDILFQLNKSKMFRELAIKDITYWVHNEPVKVKRALAVFWKIL